MELNVQVNVSRKYNIIEVFRAPTALLNPTGTDKILTDHLKEDPAK